MNIADELRKLQDLRDTGALTQEEFERAKTAVLNQQQQSALPPTASSTTVEQQTRTWAMIIHLSQLAGYVVPVAGLVAPIVIWQIKKNELPGIDIHGKIVVNWIISEIIYLVAAILLTFLFIGIPLLIALLVVGIIFPVVGGIKANNGMVWKYPLSIEFFK